MIVIVIVIAEAAEENVPARTSTNVGENRPISVSTAPPKVTTAMGQVTMQRRQTGSTR